MSFASLPFVGLVAAGVILYYLVPKKLQWVVLLLASMVFYLAGGVKSAVWLVLVAAVTWLTGLLLARQNARPAPDTLRSGAADRILHARQNALVGGDERAVDVDGNETNRHKKNLDTLEIKLILTGGFHEIKPPKFTISSFFTRKHVV